MVHTEAEPQAGGGRVAGTISHSAASTNEGSFINHHWNMNKEMNNTNATETELLQATARASMNQTGVSSTWA